MNDENVVQLHVCWLYTALHQTHESVKFLFVEQLAQNSYNYATVTCTDVRYVRA